MSFMDRMGGGSGGMLPTPHNNMSGRDQGNLKMISSPPRSFNSTTFVVS